MILRELGDICSENVPLRTKTTFGCDSIAKTLIEPRNKNELAKVLNLCRKLNFNYTLLGNGSNVVFPDEIYNNPVIKLAGNWWDRVEILSDGYFRVYSGLKLSSMVEIFRRENFDCLNFLECVPGTVGGAIAINAGAYGHSISEFVSKVCIMGDDGTEKILSSEECKFGYRSSIFSPRDVILCAELQLRHSSEHHDDHKKMRELTQPSGKTFGSIFKNPQGSYAGRLIEECNLKGYVRGDASISEKHANFLVNLGHASAKDVEHVIDRARYEVFDKFGVLLEPEVFLLRQ
jgi:UDP-N-acetylmuramate dehydrogenase